MFSKMIHEEDPCVYTGKQCTKVDNVYVIRPEFIEQTMKWIKQRRNGIKLKIVFFEKGSHYNDQYLALGDSILDHQDIAMSALRDIRINDPDFMPTNWGGGTLYWSAEKNHWEFSGYPSETMDSRGLPDELVPIFLELIKKIQG